jgi:transposase
MRYFLCPGKTDIRKGMSSLCGVIHERMGQNIKHGDVFIFIGSDKKLMKLLHAEDGGLVMYVKRLEAGRFKLPSYDEASKSYPMEWRDLVLMVEGIQESADMRLKRLRAERNTYSL